MARVSLIGVGLAAALLAGCDDVGLAPCPTCGGADLGTSAGPALERVLPGPDGGAATFRGCVFASPLAVTSRGQPEVLAASADGTIAALDPSTGAVDWEVLLPAPAGEEPYLLATPIVVGGDLFVAYQQRELSSKTRRHHVVTAVDLEARALDPGFPPVELAAVQATPDGPVTFDPVTQASRAALVHGAPTGATLGELYVSLGNIQDLQPWHGWVFELDLDAWRSAGAAAAISGTLLTTDETDCGPSGSSGSREALCGGGVWAPGGPTVIDAAGKYELIVPTGNGQLDLAGGDYANALLRTGRGLAFDPGCDPAACASFDGLDPPRACLDSCRDLFVPRMREGDPPLAPESGACDGKTLLACYAALDWDLGADSPSFAASKDALVLPGKDGAVYLVDHAHLGAMLDRVQVAAPCGTKSDPCRADWAGMMVTRPPLVDDAGGPIAIVPTFEFDATHPAGLVALRLVGSGPDRRLEELWRAPAPASAEAVAHFRRHPGMAAVAPFHGEPYVWIVDVAGQAGHGIFYGVRVRDGAIVERASLAGPGQRYTEPLLVGDVLYVPSCAGDDGPGAIEAYRIVERR